jgi:thiamine biosynthesis lipoprotein
MASELQFVSITDSATPAATSDALWHATLRLLRRLEACWSRFLPTSDVSRLNVACGRPQAVDPATITLLTTMIDAWHSAEQRFDPTTLPALLNAGYRASIDDPRRATVVASGVFHLDGLDQPTLDQQTLNDVEIDHAAGTVRLPAGMAIDPGGIGKGLAADLAATLALESGATGVLVNIGGDISLRGVAPDADWTVIIEHPDPTQGTIGNLAVAGGGGVATSSTRSRRWRHNGLEQHHIIDPWTNRPSATDLSAATVVARSGWLAEAHATAAMLTGSQGVIGYLDRHDLSGLAVTDDGRVLTTPDLAGMRCEHPTTATIGAPR